MPLVPRSMGYKSPWFHTSLPCDWIVEGGKPAAICGTDGMPSYEPADVSEGGLWIYELLVCFPHEAGLVPMLLPRSYYVSALLAPEGPVPLHHNPWAQWAYRPKVYQCTTWGGFQHIGSQKELHWRYGLAKAGEASILRDAGQQEEFEQVYAELQDIPPAHERAEKILKENLTPLQRIEYAASGNFRVRGARTGNMYLIEHGNGFAILDHHNIEKTVSYCLHPEGFMPDPDVMLATKLALEDPELEIDALENGHQTFLGTSGYTTFFDRVAYKYEKELIR